MSSSKSIQQHDTFAHPLRFTLLPEVPAPLRQPNQDRCCLDVWGAVERPDTSAVWLFGVSSTTTSTTTTARYLCCLAVWGALHHYHHHHHNGQKLVLVWLFGVPSTNAVWPCGVPSNGQIPVLFGIMGTPGAPKRGPKGWHHRTLV